MGFAHPARRGHARSRRSRQWRTGRGLAVTQLAWLFRTAVALASVSVAPESQRPSLMPALLSSAARFDLDEGTLDQLQEKVLEEWRSVGPDPGRQNRADTRSRSPPPVVSGTARVQRQGHSLDGQRSPGDPRRNRGKCGNAERSGGHGGSPGPPAVARGPGQGRIQGPGRLHRPGSPAVASGNDSTVDRVRRAVGGDERARLVPHRAHKARSVSSST